MGSMAQDPAITRAAEGSAVEPGSGDGTTVLDLASVIDARPLSRFQVWILVLIGCSVTMDGFDLQAMGFVAPALMRAWEIDLPALGPIFGAGLFGMLVGSLGLSVLADRFGRRPVLIGATMIFGSCMLATAMTRSVPEMIVLRLLTGLGIGGVMANAVALATEYSPKRRRASLLMLISCGFTGGAILGGVVSAALIPLSGWQSVFVVGGLLPLAIAVAMYRYLPESLSFLAARSQHRDRLEHWLHHIAPDIRLDHKTPLALPEHSPAGVRVAELLQGGRAPVSLLLWSVSFANLLNLFFLANWLPTLSATMGYSPSAAVLAGTTLQLGGFVGAIVMGPLIDRFGFYRVLVPAFLAAAVAIVVLGRPELPPPLLFGAVLVTGAFIVGAQPAINVLAATLYPTALRATGVGWTLGVGRVGSIVGPVAAAQLLALHWSLETLFVAAAVPAAFSSVLLLSLWRVADWRGAPSVAS